jgi:hypothetical protein
LCDALAAYAARVRPYAKQPLPSAMSVSLTSRCPTPARRYWTAAAPARIGTHLPLLAALPSGERACPHAAGRLPEPGWNDMLAVAGAHALQQQLTSQKIVFRSFQMAAALADIRPPLLVQPITRLVCLGLHCLSDTVQMELRQYSSLPSVSLGQARERHRLR